MKELKIILVLIICISWGYGLGYILNKKEVERLTYVNTQLELEYNELRNSYDWLEQKLQYKTLSVVILKQYCPDHVKTRLDEFAGGTGVLTPEGEIFIIDLCK